MLIRWPSLLLILYIISSSYLVGTPFIDWHGAIEIILTSSIIMMIANGKDAFKLFTNKNVNFLILRSNGIAVIAACLLLVLRNAYTFFSSANTSIEIVSLNPLVITVFHDLFLCFLLYVLFFFNPSCVPSTKKKIDKKVY